MKNIFIYIYVNNKTEKKIILRCVQRNKEIFKKILVLTVIATCLGEMK